MKKDKSKYSGLMEEKANLNCKLFQIIYIYILHSVTKIGCQDNVLQITLKNR